MDVSLENAMDHQSFHVATWAENSNTLSRLDTMELAGQGSDASVMHL